MAVKKILVFLLGASVVIIGFILLPLPGPGLLVIFAGLFILSSEFEWAKKHLESAKKRLRALYQKSKKKKN